MVWAVTAWSPRERWLGEMKILSPDPRDGLDQRMAEVLIHARAMEFQSLDLDVSASVSQAKQASEAR